MLRFVSNVTNVNSTELEEFSVLSLLTEEEVFFSLFVLGHIQNCLKCTLHCLLWWSQFFRIIFEDNFFGVFILSLESHIPKFSNYLSKIEALKSLSCMLNGLFKIKFCRYTTDGNGKSQKQKSLFHST